MAKTTAEVVATIEEAIEEQVPLAVNDRIALHEYDDGTVGVIVQGRTRVATSYFYHTDTDQDIWERIDYVGFALRIEMGL